MSNDKIIGGGILVGSLAGIGIYFWLLFMTEWADLTIKASAFLAYSGNNSSPSTP